MHYHIIKTLLGKEIRRQLANRGGLALAALLVVAALLMTLFSKDGGHAGALTGGVEYCFVDYWGEDGWVRHLRANVPADLQRQIKFRDVNLEASPGELLTYPAGSGAIQMRPPRQTGGQPKIWIWQPSTNSLLPFEAWFWRESARYYQQQAAAAQGNSFFSKLGATLANKEVERVPSGGIDEERSQLEGALDMRSSITSALILFALFF